MQRTNEGFLNELMEAAKARVKSGYYAVEEEPKKERRRRSLVESLRTEGRIPIIAEVKFRSPSEGVLSKAADVERIARAYERGGAAAISVLTEPEHFDGCLEHLRMVKVAVGIPVMMKDVVVDGIQVEAAHRSGADAILLMASVLAGGKGRQSLAEMVRRAHDVNLEAVVEVHDEAEYEAAAAVEADVMGINNRDLRSLSVSLETSKRLLDRRPHRKPVICESGLNSRRDVESLRRLGADGFLIGSALMKAGDPVATLQELSRV